MDVIPKTADNESRLQLLEETIEQLSGNNPGNERFQTSEAQSEKLIEHSPGGASRPRAAPFAASTSSTCSTLRATAAQPRTSTVSSAPLLHIRGWSHYYRPPSTKMSRGEAELLFDKIQNIAGELSVAMYVLPTCVANHQVSYRISGDIYIYELRMDLAGLLENHGLHVHGKAVSIVLEQSSETKRDYAQFMDDRGHGYGEVVCDEGYIASFTDFPRSLCLCSVGTKQTLGAPGPFGWKWHVGDFNKVGLRAPPVLEEDKTDGAGSVDGVRSNV